MNVWTFSKQSRNMEKTVTFIVETHISSDFALKKIWRLTCICCFFFYKPSYKKNKMAARHEATITATWGVFQMLGSCTFFSCIGYSFNFVTSQACVGLNKCLTPSLLLQPSSNWQLWKTYIITKFPSLGQITWDKWLKGERFIMVQFWGFESFLIWLCYFWTCGDPGIIVIIWPHNSQI